MQFNLQSTEADMDGSGHNFSLHNASKRAISAEDSVHLRRQKPLEPFRESLYSKPTIQQPQEQLLQSKIRQEIHQLKSKLAVNKRGKPGIRGVRTPVDSAAEVFSVKIPAHHVKGSSPNKSKSTKDVSYFRKQLEQQLSAQYSSSYTPEESFENDSDGEDDCGDKSVDSSSTRRRVRTILSLCHNLHQHVFNDFSRYYSDEQNTVGRRHSPQSSRADDL